METTQHQLNFEQGFRAYLIGVAISNTPSPLDLSFLFNLRTEILIAFVGGVVGRVPSSDEYQTVMRASLDKEEEQHQACCEPATSSSLCN